MDDYTLIIFNIENGSVSTVIYIKYKYVLLDTSILLKLISTSHCNH